ncbi:MAG: helix-turn-helix transcriptional regulator [Sphingopyxis sp.]|nr:helix-turn-helix transcriptional regulator [Sphingopyxis sp.]
MDWNKIVGANVRRLRVERKLTQEQLAHDAEIDLTYMGGIERGRRNPSVSVLGRLARALEVLPGDLLAPVPQTYSSADKSAG